MNNKQIARDIIIKIALASQRELQALAVQISGANFDRFMETKLLQAIELKEKYFTGDEAVSVMAVYSNVDLD
jgi:hypothetical protein